MPLVVDLKFSDGRSVEVNVQSPALSSILYVNPPRPNESASVEKAKRLPGAIV